MVAGPRMAYIWAMRFFACSLVLSAILASASAARADAVPPPPRNCPDGSIGETGHIGAYCRPLKCANNSECAVYGPDFSCQPTSLCIEIVEYTDWNGETYQLETVTGVCAPDASCPPNAKCDDSPKCSTAASTTASSSSGGSTTDAVSGATTGPGSSGAGASGAGGEGADGEEPERRIEGCGCTVPGGRAGGAAALLAGLALLVGTGVRRRRRAS